MFCVNLHAYIQFDFFVPSRQHVSALLCNCQAMNILSVYVYLMNYMYIEIGIMILLGYNSNNHESIDGDILA